MPYNIQGICTGLEDMTKDLWVCDLLDWQMETNQDILWHLKGNWNPVKRWAGLISPALRCPEMSDVVYASISRPYLDL